MASENIAAQSAESKSLGPGSASMSLLDSQKTPGYSSTLSGCSLRSRSAFCTSLFSVMDSKVWCLFIPKNSRKSLRVPISLSHGLLVLAMTCALCCSNSPLAGLQNAQDLDLMMSVSRSFTISCIANPKRHLVQLLWWLSILRTCFRHWGTFLGPKFAVFTVSEVCDTARLWLQTHRSDRPWP